MVTRPIITADLARLGQDCRSASAVERAGRRRIEPQQMTVRGDAAAFIACLALAYLIAAIADVHSNGGGA
jgi:hypothetical protein